MMGCPLEAELQPTRLRCGLNPGNHVRTLCVVYVWPGIIPLGTILFMKHLVIVAHPRVDSLTMALARAYVAELAALGHQHTLYDLYSTGFDPILTSAEIVQPERRSGPAEVVQAQQDLESADADYRHLPAVVALDAGHPKGQGYIDRVFRARLRL